MEEEMGILISKYIDNELPPNERKVVEDHLGKCANCSGLLQVLRTNENFLEQALCREELGDEIIDNVVKRINSGGGTPAAAPERIFAVPLKFAIPLAAAACLVLVAMASSLLLLTKSSSQNRELSSQLGKMQEMIGTLIQKSDDTEREMLSMQVKQKFKASLDSRPGSMGALHIGKHIVVYASFKDVPSYAHFELHKRKMGKEDWEEWKSVNASLTEPQFEDIGFKDGDVIEYKFAGVKQSGEKSEQTTIIKVKRDVTTPQNCIAIKCIEVKENRVAKFLVTKYFDGKPVEGYFTATIGDQIGGKHIDFKTYKEFDLTTGLALERIEDRDQVLDYGGVPFSRRNVQLTLASLKDRAAKEMWRDEEIFIPLENK